MTEPRALIKCRAGKGANLVAALLHAHRYCESALIVINLGQLDCGLPPNLPWQNHRCLGG